MIDVDAAESQEDIGLMDQKFKFEIAHKRWAALYDHESAANCKTADEACIQTKFGLIIKSPNNKNQSTIIKQSINNELRSDMSVTNVNLCSTLKFKYLKPHTEQNNPNSSVS